MQRPLQPGETAPERQLAAWELSVLVHVGLIVFLVFAVQPVPPGAWGGGGGTVEIVLNRTAAEGDSNEGEEGFSDDAAGTEQAPPAELLAALPDKSVKSNVGETAPPLSTAGRAPVTSGRQPTAAQPAPGGGQPNAGQLTPGGGRRGSPGGSGYVSVSVFGVEGRGSKFVYLFDRSSSMEGAPLAAAKRQLIESFKSLESVHQFHVIFFNTKTQSFDISGGGRRIAFATDRNKQLAANFVGGISADGGTDRLNALREAIRFAPDVIFFLSDADDPMTRSELAEIDRMNRRAQAAICVIEFGRRQAPLPDNFLAQLARQTGGQYGYVNTSTLTRQPERMQNAK